ncbi:IS256 family transposase, partial [Mesorhizobium sp. M4B.F.Ca.ET.088.02.2.1]
MMTALKVRRVGRIVSVASTRTASASMESGAQPIWTEFLRKLTRRGLRGVKLVVSDAHEGVKA